VRFSEEKLKAHSSALSTLLERSDDNDSLPLSHHRDGGCGLRGLGAAAEENPADSISMELLKEIIPKLSRVAVFGNSTNPANAESLRETEIAAGLLAVKLQYKDVRDQKDIKTAFRAAGKEGANAILAVGTPLLNAHRTEVVDLAIKSRLPAIYWRSDFVENGGLMSYGVSFTDSPCCYVRG
jgi:ABC-type uncharacterized transport system substrate-binding protein